LIPGHGGRRASRYLKLSPKEGPRLAGILVLHCTVKAPRDRKVPFLTRGEPELAQRLIHRGGLVLTSVSHPPGSLKTTTRFAPRPPRTTPKRHELFHAMRQRRNSAAARGIRTPEEAPARTSRAVRTQTRRLASERGS